MVYGPCPVNKSNGSSSLYLYESALRSGAWPLMTFPRSAVDHPWRYLPGSLGPIPCQSRTLNRWMSHITAHTGSAFIPVKPPAFSYLAHAMFGCQEGPSRHLSSALLPRVARVSAEAETIDGSVSSLPPPPLPPPDRVHSSDMKRLTSVDQVQHSDEQLVNNADLRELEKFATSFKARRIRLGFTQTNVGKISLNLCIYYYLLLGLLSISVYISPRIYADECR